MIIAMIALAAGLTADTLQPYQLKPIECVEREAGRIAKGNAEPADTIIKAADGLCATEWDDAAGAWSIFGKLGRDPGINERERATTLRIAYARAFVAITEARAKH